MRARPRVSHTLVALACFLVVSLSAVSAASPPDPPLITEPSADGLVVSAADVHMETAPMTDPDPGDTHLCSDWEIWTVSPPERVWGAGCTSGIELVHVHLADGAFEGSYAGRTELKYDTDYRLRARHFDSSGLPSGWSERFFITGSQTQVYPLELDDVATSPAPAWRDVLGADLVFPASTPPARLRLDTDSGGLLLDIHALDGLSNSIVNPGTLAAHGAARVRMIGGASGALLPESDLAFTDGAGMDHVIYLPSMNVASGDTAWFWISANGSSYAGDAGDVAPDFSVLARGAPVPWAARRPGYKVEVVATGFQLPVNIAFVREGGPDPDDPFFYVTELYGTIKVVTRDGTVGDYATGLLNFDPTGEFPGSGEQGLSGIVVDPMSGDVFASLLYDFSPPSGPHFPKVIRLHSTDGGHTASSQTTIRDMVGESQGQSHFISNLSFGPDGKLYVHMGDGFTASTALNLNSYRGKVLRMNLDGSAPPDNPFYNISDGITARDYVFAYGFRNPFGGAWRTLDGMHYEVENGPDVNDRFAKVERGLSYGWNGSGFSMTTRAIYNWNPPTAPVNIAFVQPGTWGGSGFPAGDMDHAFVTESGPTYATGPQLNGKRISEFVLDPGGSLVSGPTPFVEYDGAGKATACGLAAGPDGLYFTDLYKDQGYVSPIDRGANILRVKFVGTADFVADVTHGLPPLAVQFTDLSNVPSPVAWSWDFGDGTTSGEQNPQHTYTADGVFNVRLNVTGANGIAVAQRNEYIIAGETLPGLSAEYFDNINFSGPRILRVDPVVDFDWGGGSPDPSMGPDDFSIRWRGVLRPEFSETYTFFTTTDDGVRLRVDGTLVVDEWVDQPPTEHAGTIALVAGSEVEIEMEFYERGGGAMARLEWQSPSRSRQVIPASRLSSFYPAHTAVAPSPAPAFELSASGPNPFSELTGVRFRLAAGARARLAAYDVRGREVAVLFDGWAEAGRPYEIAFERGDRPPGVYFLRLTSGRDTITRKTVLLP